MAVKLNLLPVGFGISGPLAKALKTSRMLGIVAIAIFLVFTISISAFFLLSTSTLNTLNSDVNSLKSQITALESTETQVVLLKDRVGKIKTALGQPSAVKNLDAVNSMTSSLDSTATLSELNVDSQKVDLTAQFTTTSGVSSFLSSMTTSSSFPTVTLTTFSLNPTSGYSIGIRLNN